MNPKIPVLVSLFAIIVGCCGSPQETTRAEPPIEEVTTNLEMPASHQPPADPPPVEGEERAALITLLRTNMPVDPLNFPEEMREVTHPDRLAPLVGMTQDELVAQLGEPNAGATFNTENRAAWVIGYHADIRMSHPPILVIILNEDRVVTDAGFQLSM